MRAGDESVFSVLCLRAKPMPATQLLTQYMGKGMGKSGEVAVVPWCLYSGDGKEKK